MYIVKLFTGSVAMCCINYVTYFVSLCSVVACLCNLSLDYFISIPEDCFT